MRTGRAAGICVTLTALSGCLGAVENEATPPELACLQRTNAVMLELVVDEPETAEEGLEYLRSMVSVIDDIDHEGCSAETISNLADMRGSARTTLELLEHIRTTGGTPEQITEVQSVAMIMQTAGDAIDSEFIRREREFEGR